MRPTFVTLVVGAGPAGLLFCIVSRLLFERSGGGPEVWPVILFDKRVEYRRSHRLRIAREPLLALQKEVEDPRFDPVIDFLETCRFAPAVNRLEEELSGLAFSLGVSKERVEIGSGPGQTPLSRVREDLEATGRLTKESRLTIVGADSVHSTVREAVRGGVPLTEQSHQTVARLRVVGRDLPPRLGRVDQYRVSKVLGSIVDYRLNPNGFAEVDLFLTSGSYQKLAELGATPNQPVELTAEMVRTVDAPLFERLVEHFRTRLDPSGARIELQSTFHLEHQYVERVVYRDPAQPATVFLVGDAAISLPFFRGMACLVKCVDSLARVHCDLVESAVKRKLDRQLEEALFKRYESEVAAIRRGEVAVVQARARLVAGAREFARVSSLLPFPLQTWFLSIPDTARTPARVSAGLVLNATVAATAATLAGAGMVVSPTIGWSGWIVQILGGVVYRAAQDFESGSDKLLRRVWLIQIVLLFILGSALTIRSVLDQTRTTDLFPAAMWLVLGYTFIGGMLLYDRLGRRWFSTAKFNVDQS